MASSGVGREVKVRDERPIRDNLVNMSPLIYISRQSGACHWSRFATPVASGTPRGVRPCASGEPARQRNPGEPGRFLYNGKKPRRNAYEGSPAGPYGTEGIRDLPWHDDVRPSVRRGDVVRDHE